MSAPNPQALLFDLGGVVIDIDFDRAFQTWCAISRLPFDEIKRAFKFDERYEQHERGELPGPAYFEYLASILKLNGTFDQIAAGWNAIYVGESSETAELVRSARAHIPCFAFTNTNPTHQVAWSSMFPGVTRSFERVFTSHEIGLRKPEPKAFEHIAHAISVPLTSIMFFDDLLANVESAVSAGLQAVHVRSPSDIRNALQAVGYAL